jgi:polyferredoxin
MDIIEVSANTRDVECIRCLECVETCARPETIMIELGTKVKSHAN